MRWEFPIKAEQEEGAWILLSFYYSGFLLQLPDLNGWLYLVCTKQGLWGDGQGDYLLGY